MKRFADEIVDLFEKYEEARNKITPELQNERDRLNAEAERERDERSLRKAEQIILNIELPLRLKHIEMSDLNVVSGNDDAIKTAETYCNNFHDHLRNGYGLIFIGAPGSGKTALAAALSKSIVRRWTKLPLKEYFIATARLEIGSDYKRDSDEFKIITPSFISIPEYIGIIRESICNDHTNKSSSNYIKLLNKSSITIIDDIGVENPSDWTREQIYTLIDHAYTNKKCLIVTSNYSLDILASRIGERSVDRLYEMCALRKLECDSWRRKL